MPIATMPAELGTPGEETLVGSNEMLWVSHADIICCALARWWNAQPCKPPIQSEPISQFKNSTKTAPRTKATKEGNNLRFQRHYHGGGYYRRVVCHWVFGWRGDKREEVFSSATCVSVGPQDEPLLEQQQVPFLWGLTLLLVIKAIYGVDCKFFCSASSAVSHLTGLCYLMEAMVSPNLWDSTSKHRWCHFQIWVRHVSWLIFIRRGKFYHRWWPATSSLVKPYRYININLLLRTCYIVVMPIYRTFYLTSPGHHISVITYFVLCEWRNRSFRHK
jgi:hypothetical protein